MVFNHQPVLLQETIDLLNVKEDGIYIDGTVGRGGHAQEILKRLCGDGHLIAVDRDKAAIESVENRFQVHENLTLIHDNYIHIPQILDELGFEKVNGMIFDLGVSSPQFDNPERGFSYRHDALLDMRMNREQELTAEKIVNNYSREKLAEIIKKYGEERWADRIAEFIIDFRKKEPVKTTYDLVKIIKAAIPASARRKGGHPARRTFQALRIETNDELNQLSKMIENVIEFLVSGGRLCIISFHSLEDRIVKRSFRQLAKDCVCPPDFPVCVCDKEARVKVITRKPVMAGENEIEDNPRARSARLRAAEKI